MASGHLGEGPVDVADDFVGRWTEVGDVLGEDRLVLQEQKTFIPEDAAEEGEDKKGEEN